MSQELRDELAFLTEKKQSSSSFAGTSRTTASSRKSSRRRNVFSLRTFAVVAALVAIAVAAFLEIQRSGLLSGPVNAILAIAAVIPVALSKLDLMSWAHYSSSESVIDFIARKREPLRVHLVVQQQGDFGYKLPIGESPQSLLDFLNKHSPNTTTYFLEPNDGAIPVYACITEMNRNHEHLLRDQIENPRHVARGLIGVSITCSKRCIDEDFEELYDLSGVAAWSLRISVHLSMSLLYAFAVELPVSRALQNPS